MAVDCGVVDVVGPSLVADGVDDEDAVVDWVVVVGLEIDVEAVVVAEVGSVVEAVVE